MNPVHKRTIAEAPATVSNVACGFDILGYAIDYIGDRIEIGINETPGLLINEIQGADLSFNPDENIVGVVAKKMLLQLDAVHVGLSFNINKRIHPGSGLGSSASSAVATAIGINHLFDNPFDNSQLLEFAMSGEVIASQNYHADNVAPCLLGGFRLIRGYDPLDIVEIQYPSDLYTTIIFPQVEVKTAYARSLISEQIELKKAITQWGNVGGLISGLHSGDYDLISRSLVDVVAEPVRSDLIPHYDDIKTLGIQYDSIGVNISGSGPAIFILSKNGTGMDELINEARDIYSKDGIDLVAFTSKVSETGAYIVE